MLTATYSSTSHHGREDIHERTGSVDRATERVQTAVRKPSENIVRKGRNLYIY